MTLPAVPLHETILRRSTPVVINSFNQPTYVRNMVAKLREEGFRNIYLLDQASTNPELREWLAGLNASGDAMPLFSPKNNGPHHFFLSQMYSMFGGAPLIYTDPDLSWERLAPDFLTRQFHLAHSYRVFKVGPALTIPRGDQAKPNLFVNTETHGKMSVTDYESVYWQDEVVPGVYNAPIDTTMHLFIPYYYEHGKPLITGLRVAGAGFELKHLPWFRDDPMPADEYAFYLSNSTHTSWRVTPEDAPKAE